MTDHELGDAECKVDETSAYDPITKKTFTGASTKEVGVAIMAARRELRLHYIRELFPHASEAALHFAEENLF